MATRVPWARVVALWLFGGPTMAALIVAPSGRWDWTRGWAYVALLLGCVLVHTLAMVRWQPELVEQRTRRQPDTPTWDLVILGLMRLLALAAFLVAGWEGGRAPSIAAWGVAVGALATVAGFALVVASIAANRFFEGTVRVQAERQQRVVDSGPYGWVRHPGYVGFALVLLGGPVFLGSLWGAAIMGAAIVLLVVRTALEDRFLAQNLAGYAEYRQQVRYRWVPGLW